MLKLEPFKKEYEKRYFLKSKSYIEHCKSKVVESFMSAIEEEFKCKLYPPFAKEISEKALKFLQCHEAIEDEKTVPSCINPLRIVIWRKDNDLETYLAYLALSNNGIIELWEKVSCESTLIKQVEEPAYTQWFD